MIHPGELIRDELRARHLTQAEFARAIGRPTQMVSEIVTGKKSITAQTAIQIGAALGTSALFWLSLQAQYDIEKLGGDR